MWQGLERLGKGGHLSQQQGRDIAHDRPHGCSLASFWWWYLHYSFWKGYWVVFWVHVVEQQELVYDSFWIRIPYVLESLIQCSDIPLRKRRPPGLSLVESHIVYFGAICDGDNHEGFSVQVEGQQGEVRGGRYVGGKLVEYSSVGEREGREHVWLLPSSQRRWSRR